MKTNISRFLIAIVVVSLCAFPLLGRFGGVQAQGSFPPTLRPSLSSNGLALDNGVPPLIVVADLNPAMQGIQVPTAPDVAAAIADPAAANAAFSFTFVAAGGTDPAGKVCQTFPDQAKTAFIAAGSIWTSTIQSSVPIAISACWSNIGSSNILGYSGYASSYRDFSGAPKPNTWYESSLANALHGSDLDNTKFDDYITYNSGFSWYFGTDGHPTAGTYDLVTVAAHEIAHGLNFSGTAAYSGGIGSYGGGTGFPNIYDTFLEDSGGTKLTAYTNSSAALGSLMTSDSLWFDGTNANAANAGSRVKIYAPTTWTGGSSYSHLDYNTFAGTANSMMVYAVSSASAQHNPGPVTKGLLKDMGWTMANSGVVSTIYLPLVMKAPAIPSSFSKSAPSNGAPNQPTNPTLSWGASSNASSYQYCLDNDSNSVCNNSWVPTGTSTSAPLSGLAPSTTYSWQVQAVNAAGTTVADGGTWWTFTTAALGGNWTTIMSENFEGSFPGVWQLYDWSTPASGYKWGNRTCNPYAGSYSGWGAGGGSNGSGLGCGSNYPNNVNAWMIYGPFNLTGATAADLTYKVWTYSENNIDYVGAYASIDNYNYSGWDYWGDSQGWQSGVLDLSNVYTLGNLMGQPNVWITFVFYSNANTNYAQGGYIDNIVLRKCVSGVCAAGASAAPSSSNPLIVAPAKAIRPR